MLKAGHKDKVPTFAHEHPRKQNKIVDVLNNQYYDEFKGQILDDVPENSDLNGREVVKGELSFGSFQEENVRNSKVYQSLKTGEKKIRKVGDMHPQAPSKKIQMQQKKERKQQEKKEETKVHQVKLQEGAPVEPKTEQPSTQAKSKEKKKPQKKTGSSNWSSFLQTSSKPGNQKAKQTQSVALDCQFVRHNQEELLARLSIVDESGSCLLDTFVKPQKHVTDFVTNITGITYTHLKNAPSCPSVIEKAKKFIYNKILVGHTISKDIGVCGLAQWKGWKALVDISEYPPYKQGNGKLISLKNLTMKHLGKSIQGDRHSSVQDATATMNLYLLNRSPILSHLKII